MTSPSTHRPPFAGGSRLAGAALLLVLAAAWAGGAQLVSNRDRSLAVTAWGGLAAGATLRLHNACRYGSAECTWVFLGGQLFAERDPNLFIKAAEVRHGAALVVTARCPRETPGCSWTWRDGMFVSSHDPSLAIAAWGGARPGTALRLSADCRPNNPDCTWSR